MNEPHTVWVYHATDRCHALQAVTTRMCLLVLSAVVVTAALLALFQWFLAISTKSPRAAKDKLMNLGLGTAERRRSMDEIKVGDIFIAFDPLVADVCPLKVTRVDWRIQAQEARVWMQTPYGFELPFTESNVREEMVAAGACTRFCLALRST